MAFMKLLKSITVSNEITLNDNGLYLDEISLAIAIKDFVLNILSWIKLKKNRS